MGRFFPVFTPEVLLVIAVVGVITLFMAATIAITTAATNSPSAQLPRPFRDAFAFMYARKTAINAGRQPFSAVFPTLLLRVL